MIPASETWSRIRPSFSGYGITRIANITGLDRIGIPVYMAVRPNSRGLSVSQGKGLTDMDAKVSAAAESIEAWHAERPQNALVLERYDELSRRDSVIDPQTLPLVRNSNYSKTLRLPWTQGVNFTTNSQVWAPFEMVHADATLPRMPGNGAFVFSTNGLASGNTSLEAIFHAACELIERDALALWKIRTERHAQQTRIDNSSVDEPVCRELVNLFVHSGFTPMIWNVTSDIAIPTFRVLLFDQWAGAGNTPYATAFGAGCHPDSAVALRRALTEAAQSRLTAIAGSRDDGPRQRYEAVQSEAAADYYRGLSSIQGELAFPAIKSIDCQSIEDGLHSIIGMLTKAGLTQLVTVDLTRDDSPLSVVRCIIPGLEGPSSSPSYLPGRRAKAVAQ